MKQQQNKQINYKEFLSHHLCLVSFCLFFYWLFASLFLSPSCSFGLSTFLAPSWCFFLNRPLFLSLSLLFAWLSVTLTTSCCFLLLLTHGLSLSLSPCPLNFLPDWPVLSFLLRIVSIEFATFFFSTKNLKSIFTIFLFLGLNTASNKERKMGHIPTEVIIDWWVGFCSAHLLKLIIYLFRPLVQISETKRKLLFF